MLTFVASLPPAFTRRELLRLLIIDPPTQAAEAIRRPFTSIEGTDLARLLYHFFAPQLRDLHTARTG